MGESFGGDKQRGDTFPMLGFPLRTYFRESADALWSYLGGFEHFDVFVAFLAKEVCMRSLWKLLVLCLLAFSPCVSGCSSQISEEEAERREAEDEDAGSEEDDEDEEDEEEEE